MYIRGWMQMVLAPNDLFSWNNNTMKHNSCNGYVTHCCPMHNDTYSVHDRSLKPWRSRPPCSQTFYYVFSPPLSGLNWCSLSPIGGPGPPTPKVASPLLGSAHTPFPGSRTVKSTAWWSENLGLKPVNIKFHWTKNFLIWLSCGCVLCALKFLCEKCC